MKRTLSLSIKRIESHRIYLTNLLNNLTDGIIIVDNNNEIVFANESLKQVLESGDSSPGPSGKINNLFPSDKAIGRIGELIAQVRNQKTRVQDIIRVQSTDSRERYLEVHAGELVLPPQRNPEIIVVIRDITALIAIEKQIYQADKLATIGRLAAGVAHEINNPMASIMTCAEGLLRSERNSQDEVKEYMEIIQNSARRCKMITTKLLDYSITSGFRSENVDIRRVLDEAISLLQFEAGKKKATLNVDCNGTVPVIRGSRDSLVQVFVNLILNSIQAVDENGTIEISVSAENDAVSVLITDNGCGISADNRDRVFDPFFTTKPVGVGTGLGLSVSQGIIKRHNGTIEIIDSRKGHTSLLVSFASVSGKESDYHEQ